MSELQKRFSLRLPLVVAPLGGGPTTPELVIETCEAGALGSLAAAYLQPEGIQADIDAIRKRTSRPFAINLFTPMPEVTLVAEQIQAALDATRGYRKELGLAEPKVSPPFHPDFDRQFEVVLRAKPAIFSFVFGLLDRTYVDACRSAGILVSGTATTVDEGLALEESGVDLIVVQGVEAGGHRGTFDPTGPDPGVSTLELTREMSRKTRLPVIAAGGIMNGRDILSMLRAGADAVQMGTAFLLCPEAGTSAPYRQALSAPGHRSTRLTRSFSGRLAQGLENRFMSEMEKKQASLLPFPAQNAFTRDLRARSVQIGSPDFLSLWAGTGMSAIRAGKPARNLIEDLVREME